MINLEYDKSKCEAPYYLELVDMNWEYPIKSNRVGYWCDKAHLKQQLENLLKEFDRNEFLELINEECITDFKSGDFVLVKDNVSGKWELDVFKSYEPNDVHPYKCVTYSRWQCIQYKGNEEKLGIC